ncbi:Gcv operon activator [Raoultella terrigena]|uniref:Gcv operon activator n=1 Tax=Raoultella terrigena TaxID=577 RepID=A0A4U9CZV2_RAOTE|nr:Gcv operon activator [Raoultella terrigena]
MSRSALPFNTVETFLVTARHLNLTHAARELCLTQGAVSRQIAALEGWFGFPLLNATRAGCACRLRAAPSIRSFSRRLAAWSPSPSRRVSSKRWCA